MTQSGKRSEEIRAEVIEAANWLRKRLDATNRQTTKATRVCIDQDEIRRLIRILEVVPALICQSHLSESLPQGLQCESPLTCSDYISIIESGGKCATCGFRKVRF